MRYHELCLPQDVLVVQGFRSIFTEMFRRVSSNKRLLHERVVNMNDKNRDKASRDGTYLGIGISLGLSLGAGIGVALGAHNWEHRHGNRVREWSRADVWSGLWRCNVERAKLQWHLRSVTQNDAGVLAIAVIRPRRDFKTRLSSTVEQNKSRLHDFRQQDNRVLGEYGVASDFV